MEEPDSYKKKIKTADIRKAQNRFKKSGFVLFCYRYLLILQ